MPPLMRSKASFRRYQVHLAGVRGEDSRSVQRVTDCRRALQEINNGDALHLVQIAIAVAADDLDTLKERVRAVINETRAWFSLRQEVGELLSRAVGFFSAQANQRRRAADHDLAGHVARTGADAGAARLSQALDDGRRAARRGGRRRVSGLSQLVAGQARHP